MMKRISPARQFFECFTDLSGDLGLTLTNRWMRLPPSETEVLGRSQETFGYEQFLELWRQDDASRRVGRVARHRRPRCDHGDSRATGAGARRLEAVLAKNETIDLLCPVPATLAVFNERAIARALIAQVQQQFRGEHLNGFPAVPALGPRRQNATVHNQIRKEVRHEASATNAEPTTIPTGKGVSYECEKTVCSHCRRTRRRAFSIVRAGDVRPHLRHEHAGNWIGTYGSSGTSSAAIRCLVRL